MAAVKAARPPSRRSTERPAAAKPALRISARDARRLAILAQRLAGPRPRPDRRGIMEVIRDIGYLQLDPTNVVARNPLLALWSRLGRYDPALLDDLLAKRREVFETVSLIVPTSDLAIHAAAMRAYRAATSLRATPSAHERLGGAGGGTWPQRAAKFLALNPQLRRHVLTRLRRDGPLPLTAFEDRSIVSWTSGGWNDERNVTMMLAVLQRRGEVMVAGRQRGQKLWAIADGWLPKAEAISTLEVERRATERAVGSLGVATVKQLRWHYAFSRHVTATAVAALERTGRIVRVAVDPDEDDRSARKRTRIAPMRKSPVAAHSTRSFADAVFYAPADIERRLRDARDDWTRRTTLLSPFDNLIIDRDRADVLFDFFYRMEIYVPPHLRRRGYWAMPILHDDRVIGTVDPRFERDEGTLVVNAVVAEPGAPGGRAVARAIAGAVDDLAAFVGAREVMWPRKLPAEWRDVRRA